MTDTDPYAPGAQTAGTPMSRAPRAGTTIGMDGDQRSPGSQGHGSPQDGTPEAWGTPTQGYGGGQGLGTPSQATRGSATPSYATPNHATPSYGTPSSPGSQGPGPRGPQGPGHVDQGGATPPPTQVGPPVYGGGGGPGGGGSRRRRPVALAAAALVAVLLAGGVGGVVGYEAASSGGGSSSVLSGASDTDSDTDSGQNTGTAAPGSVESVAQKVLPSVVQLKGASGEGSGIVISADGLILTNAHVLEAGRAQQQSSGLSGLFGGGQGQQQQSSTTSLSAVFQNGTAAPVQVVGTDATADLAVVRAQNVSGLTPIQLGDSAQLQVGQEVVAVGSPLGLSGTVTTGIVSALQRPVASQGAESGQASVIDAVQTDAAINPGNSGGALVDMQGRVVGITSAIASLGQSSGSSGQQSGSIGLGFAIPINQAARIGQELAQSGSATQAVLGVQVADASPTGATLGQVTPGGAAASAGLAQGDVVTRMGDRVIDDANSLGAAIRSQEPGAQVTLTVSSAGGAPRPVNVTLGSERAPTS